MNVTISDRDAIGVKRWGRYYHYSREVGDREHTGLEVQQSNGTVWCVTVPSGQIVVRRNGFSMVCGNCAEALALRKAFPQELSGLYSDDEMAQADMPDRQRADTASDTTADLDRFAAVTGEAEPIPTRDIVAEAREHAERGKAVFTAFWQSLSSATASGVT
jgi:hypothetical protein